MSSPADCVRRGLSAMASNEGSKEAEEFVYRISTAEEWEELQRSAATFGGSLDQSTGCFHLSKLHQVQSTLQNFFLNVKEDLYLLQIDANKLGNGLVYEAVDDANVFPHFYGPSRSFSPLPLDAVTKAEKLTLSDGLFKCMIFNFGDSNSDTGGFAAAMGYEFGYPYGRSFFHRATGRLSDGRLVIDFLCENLKTNYLTPYLESLGPDFTNGVNFATAGATTLPRNVPFNLNVQLLQFARFHNHSLQLHSNGFKNVVREKDFRKALYTIDIGQNDLWVALNSFSYAEAIEKIPSFISEIRDAILAIYKLGGRKFWIHNTGPLGCLPAELATRKTNITDLDPYGCIKSLNEGAKAFNAKLNNLCQELRIQIKDSTVVYVDIYSIKYNLIANSTHYGFENPLMVCCGYGGAPYNFDLYIKCRDIVKGANLCQQGSPRINWDGTHYSEPANAFVASEILSTKYSTPPLKFNFFCNKS